MSGAGPHSCLGGAAGPKGRCRRDALASRAATQAIAQRGGIIIAKRLPRQPGFRGRAKRLLPADVEDFIGYRGVPNSIGERGMGNGERESWQKNFRPPPISHPARPPAPSRAARQDLPALLKPANHTLAFRRWISAESSFVNAKHFQPRSFSDAPTRYRVLSSITRNLS